MSAEEPTGLMAYINPLKQFGFDSVRLVQRYPKNKLQKKEEEREWDDVFVSCTKPDAKEFREIAMATTGSSSLKGVVCDEWLLVGFLVMGFIGYFVKLIHIPINQIIVGA